MQTLISNLEERLAPAISGLGYELLCVEFTSGGKDPILRLFIDSADGIGLEDCERVSREVSALLDVDDPITEAYRLEVSSPGLDRPLVKPAHFQQFQGCVARIRLRESVEGRRNFKGRILGSDAQQIEVEVDAEHYTLPIADIERARLVPNYD